jgi:ATP-dependent DNA ligase
LPRAARQRGLAHRMRNLAAKVPEDIWPEFKVRAGGLDGELVVLDDARRPLFNELLFGRRRPTDVAFDLLIADGVDLWPRPLKRRKAMLAQIGERAERWIALTKGIVDEGC